MTAPPNPVRARRRVALGRALAIVAIAFGAGGAAVPDRTSPLARAQASLDAGRPRDALAPVRQAISADPAAAAPHLLAGRIYLALERGVAAEAEIDKARDGGASRDATRADMAAAYLLEGDAARAADEADPAGVPPALVPEIARVRGRALLASGDVGGAGAAFALALRLRPANGQLWTDIGRFRLATGDRGAAIFAANRAVTIAPHLVDALLLKGEVSRDQYGLVSALPWFARAAAVDAGSVPALLDQAATLGDLGRTRAMLERVRAVLRLDPANPQAFYLQAVLAARGGQFAVARRMLDRAGDAFDDVPAAMLLDGAIDMSTGSIEQAIDHLGRLVAIQPGNDRARRLLAAAQWQAGDAEAVVQTLRPIVQRVDADSYATLLIARAYERQGRRDIAASYLDRALRAAGAAAMPGDPASLTLLARAAGAQPGDIGAASDYARALLGSGQGAQALTVATATRDRNPGALDAQLLMGDTLDALGRHGDAVANYRAAANLAFTEPVALRLIDALRRSGDFAGAAGVLNLFLGQNPMDVPARTLAAAYLMETDRPAQAAGVLDRLARQVGARDAALLNNLAWARYRTGARESAIALAAKAHRLLPANAAIADSYGWMLLDSRRAPASGMALLEQAVASAPGEPIAQARLAAARARFPAG